MIECVSCRKYQGVSWETELCEKCSEDNEKVLEGMQHHLIRGSDWGNAVAACFRLAVKNAIKEIEEEEKENGQEK